MREDGAGEQGTWWDEEQAGWSLLAVSTERALGPQELGLLAASLWSPTPSTALVSEGCGSLLALHTERWTASCPRPAVARTRGSLVYL